MSTEQIQSGNYIILSADPSCQLTSEDDLPTALKSLCSTQVLWNGQEASLEQAQAEVGDSALWNEQGLQVPELSIVFVSWLGLQIETCQ